MKKKSLLILGAGQYGQVAKEVAEAMECFAEVAFLDDNNPAAIGKLDEYKGFRGEFSCAFVAMGNPQLRLRWLAKLEEDGFELPVLIHPKGYVSLSSVLGKGTIVEAMAVVNTEAIVETGGLLCAGCIVNHNSHVMRGCQIDCGAVVESAAIVPEGTKVGSGTIFKR